MLKFEIEPKWMRYIFSKGFLSINGASLTVSDVDSAKNGFDVWLIPETLRSTTFSEKKVGDFVNIEIDRSTQIIVDAVRTAVQEQMSQLLPKFIEQFLGSQDLPHEKTSLLNLLTSSIMEDRKNHEDHSN